MTTTTPDAAQIGAAKAAAADPPALWRQQPDGRFRWWAGNIWTNGYTRDPTGEIEHAQAEATPTTTTATADDLKKLADLHLSGILTDDEFADLKRKHLGI